MSGNKTEAVNAYLTKTSKGEVERRKKKKKRVGWGGGWGGLMWALKNSFLVSMSTMYLNFDRRKTRLETVLHTLLVCESQRSLLSMVIPKRRCSDT